MPHHGERAEPLIPVAIPGSWSEPGIEAPSRGPVYGARVIATEHTTASQIGMRVLEAGGNAVDAAIAASAAQVVLKPYYTHLGGDAFALLWHRRTGAVECLNAGGRASRAATPELFPDGIAPRGPRASTVPGLVDAWCELHAGHGSRPLAELLRPAIDLARDGFPVSTRLAGAMAMLADGPQRIDDEHARAMFLKGGRPYAPGETFRQPDVARTLEAIAADGRDGFYGGRVGRAMIDAFHVSGGLIDEADLAEPAALWHQPISVTYRGVIVYEQALPSQGIILAEALSILDQLSPLEPWSPGAVHAMVEATRIAFTDCRRHAGDPLAVDVPVDRLLSGAHARECAAQIDPRRTRRYEPMAAPGDTTSFVVADEDLAVSFIQSVFWPWGSGVVIPGTGILMNNRMTGFSLRPGHPNVLAPGKRTVHTLNTFLAVRDGRLVAGGGTPGGDFQVQTNLQTIAGVIDWGLDLQAAIDAPRWATLPGGRLAFEARYPRSVVDDLAARGHDVVRAAAWDPTLSRSQVVASNPHGGWLAASDLRGEGVALSV